MYMLLLKTKLVYIMFNKTNYVFYVKNSLPWGIQDVKFINYLDIFNHHI